MISTDKINFLFENYSELFIFFQKDKNSFNFDDGQYELINEMCKTISLIKNKNFFILNIQKNLGY